MSHGAKNSTYNSTLTQHCSSRGPLLPNYYHLCTAELVEAIKVAVSTNILRVTINKPLTRLASSSQEGEKKQKKSSSPAKKKGTHNFPALPQPLPEKATNTEGKMERVDSVGLSEKPPITDGVDKKDPPQWFTDHMDKVRQTSLSQLGWLAEPPRSATVHTAKGVTQTSISTRERSVFTHLCVN